MTQSTYTGVLDLASGAFRLAAVLVVWRRELRAIVRLLAWQGLALAIIPLTVGIYQEDTALVTVGVVVLLLRAVALPLLLARAAGTEDHERRESTPLVNTTTSLLITAALTVLAYAVTRPIIALDPSPAPRAVPAAVAGVLVAPPAYRIEILHREPNRVHARVASGAGRISAVLDHCIPHG